MPAGHASEWRRAQQGKPSAGFSRTRCRHCRALQERVLLAVREHCACGELAGVCGVGWSTVVSWNEVQLQLVVSDVRRHEE